MIHLYREVQLQSLLLSLKSIVRRKNREVEKRICRHKDITRASCSVVGVYIAVSFPTEMFKRIVSRDEYNFVGPINRISGSKSCIEVVLNRTKSTNNKKFSCGTTLIIVFSKKQAESF
jgi:hypothetical protein